MKPKPEGQRICRAFRAFTLFPLSANFRRCWLITVIIGCACIYTHGQVLNLSQAGVIETGYGAVPNIFGASAVFVKGNYAYVVGTGDVLEIIDITLPGLPLHKGSLANGEGGASILRPEAITVVGNYAYITSLGDNTLEIVDVSDPAHPVHAGKISDGGGVAPFFENIWGVEVKGDYAYVTSTASESFQIIDISDPADPWPAGYINNDLFPDFHISSVDLAISGTFAYVGAYDDFYFDPDLGYNVTVGNHIRVIDISDPYDPVPVGAIYDGGGAAPYLGGLSSIQAVGTYLYVTTTANDGTGALEIIDISDPKNPAHKGGILDGGGVAPVISTAYGLEVAGNYAFIGNIGASVFTIIDVSNPANPTSVGSLSNSILAQARSVQVQGKYAYVTGRVNSVLAVIDISTPASPTLKTTVVNGDGGAILYGGRSVVVNKNYAYVVTADATRGNALEIVDVSNPSFPTHKGSIKNGDNGASINAPFGVAVSGNYAFITSTSGNALEVVDVTNPTSPSHKAVLANGTNGAVFVSPKGIAISGKYAYITNFNSLEIVDISNPASPTHVANLANGGGVAPFLSGAFGIAVSGIYAYITCTGTPGLEIVDISTPSAPVHKAFLADGGGTAPYILPQSPYLNHIAVSGNYVYIASYNRHAVEVVDVSNPSAPVHKGSFVGANSYPTSLGLFGNYAIVSYYHETEENGVAAIDITNPAAPAFYGAVENGDNGALLDGPRSIFVSGNYVYAVNFGGLYYAMDVLYLYGHSVSGFFPKTGAAGSSVVVTGQNFNTFLTASIGGVPATIKAVTATTAVIEVPEGATVSEISLTNGGQRVTTGRNFMVVPTAQAVTTVSQTGFTASWTDVDASEYFLDVSKNLFATKLASYDSVSVFATSTEVSGLTPGTIYQFRVRSSDFDTVSAVSNTVVVITIPATPVPKTPNVVGLQSFLAQWDAVQGASGYYVDVATDNGFTTMVTGYENVTAKNNFLVVSGLTAGTTYYFRVSSFNASGTSPASALMTVVTVPSAPVAQTATGITTTGFTASWPAVTGASNYFIDVSNNDFTTTLASLSNIPVGNKTSFDVTGLDFGTNYQYRVRASNAGGVSISSNVINVLTATPAPTAQPTALKFSNGTSSSVTVSFTAATGSPNGYLVLRSVGSPPSVPPANASSYSVGSTLGNAIVAFNGAGVTFFDGGLSNSTTYTYTVYAFNGTGVATTYLLVTPLQGNVTLDVTPPTIATSGTPNPATITAGNTPIFNAVITDNVSVASAKIFYRGISKKTFNSAPLTPSGLAGNYTVQIQTTWYDSVGLEYYFWAVDQNGNETAAPSSNSFAQLITPSLSVPALPSGTGTQAYRIVSFPYQLTTDNKITTVYNGVPWNDNTKASIAWWDPTLKNGSGDYLKYGGGSGLQTIDVGKGYWVLVASDIAPQVTNVPSPKYNRSNLYTMTLKPKWNQIGNPYPVPIVWADVIAYNKAINPSASFSDLTVYDGSGYVVGKTLKAFEGAFVKNLGSSDINIIIPFPGQASSGGRQSSHSTADLTSMSWRIPLFIYQGDVKSELGGFGMDPEAADGPDRLDLYNPPRFVDMPEINFSNSFQGAMFSRDVVEAKHEQDWNFTPAGRIGQETVLRWSDQIVAGSKELILFDLETLTIVDMTKTNSYNFTLSAKSRFKIFFGQDVLRRVHADDITVASAYPNPTGHDGMFNVALSLPDASCQYLVRCETFNLQGKIVSSSNTTVSGGTFTFSQVLGDQPSGVYLYKISVSNCKSTSTFTGKIAKP